MSENFGKITDEGIARLRKRIGVERKGSNMHRRGLLRLTSETIRRFALGSGDDNPVYIDNDYAAKSRFGTRVCPPSIIGFLERSNGASDGLPGCHTIWRTAEYEWLRPMLLDEALDSSSYLRKVEVIPSKFGGGQSARQDYETEIYDSDKQPVATYKTSWHRFERSKAKKASKYGERELAQYTPEDIERIKAD